MSDLHIDLDRAKKQPLTTQLYLSIREAIEDGRLAAGSRLPSWRDLAVQLGISRGTVRVAYQRLIDEQFAVGFGAAGTRIADRHLQSQMPTFPVDIRPLPELFHDFGTSPLVFQMGVPSQRVFPFKLWSRILGSETRRFASEPVSYPDPRGELVLRTQIAAYLGIARGIRCDPGQIFVTAGFSAALAIVIHGLRLEGGRAWMEEPGFPLTRTTLQLAGVTVRAIPVDEEGLNFAAASEGRDNPALVVVTPGQQAPLGMTMSLSRRLSLLAWAQRNDVWIIEDDYLSELQLTGRAAPAFASLDHKGRVLHIGSFSKTISPALRLGFVVVPSEMARHFGDFVACSAPAPMAAIQRAVAAFLQEGHYLRHLRRMKRHYIAQREALVRTLKEIDGPLKVEAATGTAIMARLPEKASDTSIAQHALQVGLAPVPLSPWYMNDPASAGLLLGITNLNERQLLSDCRRLTELVQQHL